MKKIDIQDVQKLADNCFKFLKNYKEKGFKDAIAIAKELALELKTEVVFKNIKRIRKVKHQFDYEAQDQPIEVEDPEKKIGN